MSWGRRTLLLVATISCGAAAAEELPPPPLVAVGASPESASGNDVPPPLVSAEGGPPTYRSRRGFSMGLSLGMGQAMGGAGSFVNSAGIPGVAFDFRVGGGFSERFQLFFQLVGVDFPSMARSTSGPIAFGEHLCTQVSLIDDLFVRIGAGLFFVPGAATGAFGLGGTVFAGYEWRLGRWFAASLESGMTYANFGGASLVAPQIQVGLHWYARGTRPVPQSSRRR